MTFVLATIAENRWFQLLFVFFLAGLLLPSGRRQTYEDSDQGDQPADAPDDTQQREERARLVSLDE